MKFSLVLVVLCSALEISWALTAISDECMKKYPAPLHVAGEDLTRPQKCQLACTFEEKKVMDSNGNIDPEKVPDVAKQLWPNEYPRYAAMFSKCGAKIANVKDNCDKVYLYAKCFGQDAIDIIFS